MNFTTEALTLAASILATLLGAGLSLFAKRAARIFTGVELVALANSSESARDLSSEVRLSEVVQALKEEESRRSLYRYSSASLVIGQFIVGGVLTSSFVTKTVSEPIIGLLGLLVLASSLVSQHFRPDLLHKSSVVKIHRLRTLKRWIEDELYEATRSGIDDARILATRKRATIALQEIEQGEIDFLDGGKPGDA